MKNLLAALPLKPRLIFLAVLFLTSALSSEAFAESVRLQSIEWLTVSHESVGVYRLKSPKDERSLQPEKDPTLWTKTETWKGSPPDEIRLPGSTYHPVEVIAYFKEPPTVHLANGAYVQSNKDFDPSHVIWIEPDSKKIPVDSIGGDTRWILLLTKSQIREATDGFEKISSAACDAFLIGEAHGSLSLRVYSGSSVSMAIPFCSLKDLTKDGSIQSLDQFFAHGSKTRDRKRTLLSGYLRLEFEGTSLYSSRKAWIERDYSKALWLESSQSYVPQTEFDQKAVIIEGEYDPSKTGHMGLWRKGSLSNYRVRALVKEESQQESSGISWGPEKNSLRIGIRQLIDLEKLEVGSVIIAPLFVQNKSKAALDIGFMKPVLAGYLPEVLDVNGKKIPVFSKPLDFPVQPDRHHLLPNEIYELGTVRIILSNSQEPPKGTQVSALDPVIVVKPGKYKWRIGLNLSVGTHNSEQWITGFLPFEVIH